MAHRTFVDSDGVTWQVWEVHPTTVERRLGERRGGIGHCAGAERRSGGDRRVRDEERVFLGPELAQGWLAFHSSAQKRRYAPIPAGWEKKSAAELAELCAAATPVSTSGRPRRGNGSEMKQPA